ncbi:uncharacterized protein LOC120193276 isoform X2 [Hibiscus syriacus]|uniref:uncharacterized protein LOC120193276 isoform X2 n=1 Tax=Hibiscus syriacus TaxID=106335 RepID=UPI001924C86B|nr:uncharacterized protein LOC120193276 isoform X2 [Hibiscus syriacus]
MGEEDDVKELFESPGFVDHHQKEDRQRDHQWKNMENDDGETSACESSSMEVSSTTRSSISDMIDDASSSSSSTSTNSNGPLYELSELMAQLPIKCLGFKQLLIQSFLVNPYGSSD